MTSSTKRIYLVTDPDNRDRMVEASSPSQALRAVVDRQSWKVRTIKAIDALTLHKQGVQTIDAGLDPTDPMVQAAEA